MAFAANIQALAADDTSLYWIGDTAVAGQIDIMKMQKDSGTPSVLVADATGAEGLSVNSASVFWVDVGTDAVMEASKSGGAAVAIAEADAGFDVDYLTAANERAGYWVVHSSAGTEPDKIMQTPVDGRPAALRGCSTGRLLQTHVRPPGIAPLQPAGCRFAVTHQADRSARPLRAVRCCTDSASRAIPQSRRGTSC